MKNNCFFLIPILSFFFFSCDKDKYPEGGRHAKAAKNIVNNWTLKQFTVDGADSLNQVDHRFRESEALRVINTSHNSSLFSSPAQQLNAGYPLILFQTPVSFVDNENKLQFKLTGGIAYPRYPFVIADAKWEILELQRSEIKLQMHNYQNDKVYEMVWQSGD